MTHTVLTLIAILSLIPACCVSFRTAIRRDMLFWLTTFLAMLGPVLWVVGALSGPWQTALGSAVWSSITATLILFVGVAGQSVHGWRLAPLLMPYLLVMGVFSAFLPEGMPLEWQGRSSWLWIHIILSLLTYGLLTLSAVAALAVLIQERAMKTHRPDNRLTRTLPAVVDGDHLTWRLLVAAELVLGLGVSSGIATLYLEHGHLWLLDHKTLFVISAFVLVGLLLLGHRCCGVRGRIAARVVLSAWLLLTLGWLGVKFVTQVVF